MFKYESVIKAIVIFEKVSIFVVVILTIMLIAMWSVSNILQ